MGLPTNSPSVPLAAFSPPAREWFTSVLGAPTAAQEQAWAAIREDNHALVVAPTGSGKTLAAFFWAIDHLAHLPRRTAATARCRVLYVSPLKALAADVERNLRAPIAGIGDADQSLADVSVAMRTGDTPPAERRAFAKTPSDILVTTPESLYLLLTSQARDALRGVETVIVDELHSLLPTKRGAHLALSLERLDAITQRPCQRIGLSATIEPVTRAAAFLSGTRPLSDGGREVRIAQPEAVKDLAVRIEVPLPDLTDPAARPASTDQVGEQALAAAVGPRSSDPGGSKAAGSDTAGSNTHTHYPKGEAPSIWQPVTERIVSEVEAHRSTLVFANSRRAAERLAARLNEEWERRHGSDLPEPGALRPAAMPAQSGTAVGLSGRFARAHHGSMSAAQRREIEAELKEGRLPCVVATSTLELGIDMGAIDLVIMLGVPPSVSSGLQRLGRAGHQVGAVSSGTIFPMHPGELLPAAVIAGQVAAGQIEEQRWPAAPLDVLAQQLIAMTAMEPWSTQDVAQLVRRAAPFEKLGEKSLRAVLDMLSGRYPSDDFAALKPRLVWNRQTDMLTARPGSRQLAVLSGGTIPDSGLYGVFVAPSSGTTDADSGSRGRSSARQRGGRRVGELDEEMVYESRVGDRITLGTTTWRIAQITPDRVLVEPAPGEPGRLPFWKGDTPGRALSLSRMIGQEARLLADADADMAATHLSELGLDAWAQDNLLRHLSSQEKEAALPHDRRVVIESFADDAGDRRVVIHSLFGGRVNAPWALLLAGQLAARLGFEPQYLHSDDGIVLHLPAGGARVLAEDLLPPVIGPEELTHLLASELASSPQFAARFRQAAARALLLPRGPADKRQPLWQQRHRAATLLSAAAKYPQFPIVHEAVRECLQDDWDIEGLASVLADLAAGRIDIVHVETHAPSPFARSLMLAFTGTFLYDGDMPLAEQRASALALDPELLAELVGGSGPQLAEIVPPHVGLQVAQELRRRAEGFQLTGPEPLFDWVRTGGPLCLTDLLASSREAGTWVDELCAAGRLVRCRIGWGEAVVAPVDVGLLLSAIGPDSFDTADIAELPPEYVEPVPDATRQLLARIARRVLMVGERQAAGYLGTSPEATGAAIEKLVREGTLIRLTADAATTLLPELASDSYTIDASILERLRRRTLRELRRQIRPASPAAYTAFLAEWHHLGARSGESGVADAVASLGGARLPASAIESLVLPARVTDYQPHYLDALIAAGEVMWCGQGSLPGHDGSVRLLPGDGSYDPLVTLGPRPTGPLPLAILGLLRGGALFAQEIVARISAAALPAGPGLEMGVFVPPRPDDELIQQMAGVTLSDTIAALWELAWSGWVTSNSLRALRAYLAHRASPARPQRQARRTIGSLRAASLRSASLRTGAWPARGPGAGLAASRPTGMPDDALGSGRWVLTPMAIEALAGEEPSATVRAHANTVALTERFGVVTSAACATESSLAELYPVLSALEESGALRRGYFVEHAGAAQFAPPEAVEMLRSPAGGGVRLLAAMDPANPYGVTLAWPEPVRATGHRPARRAGSIVVIGQGGPLFYLEAGGATALSYTDERDDLAQGSAALHDAIAQGRMGSVLIKSIDDASALQARAEGHPLALALIDAGFVPSPAGLRCRSAS